MSTYIKAVEMPKEHPLYITLRPDGSVHVWDSYGESYVTQAIPVPNHGGLIDADSKTFPTFHRKELNDYMKGWNACLRSVQQQPIIIPSDREVKE